MNKQCILKSDLFKLMLMIHTEREFLLFIAHCKQKIDPFNAFKLMFEKIVDIESYNNNLIF